MKNLAFFINKGVFKNDEIDYIFLINDFKCAVKIPEFKNVTVIKKENSTDLEAFRYGLEKINLKNYAYYIFINSSCCGPYLPAYVTEPWYKLITHKLTKRVKLVSPIVEFSADNLGAKALEKFKTINPDDTDVPFLHSYMFATDQVGVKILLKYNALPKEEITKRKAVTHYERLISSAILNEGYHLISFLAKYRNVDINEKSNWVYKKWSKTKDTCPEIPGNYSGIDVHPFEIMFVKNIRPQNITRPKRKANISIELTNYIDRYSNWL